MEISKIKKLLEKEQYDLVILHTTLTSFYVRMAVKSMKHKPKVIYMCHGYLFKDKHGLKNRLLLHCEKKVAKVTDKLIVMNVEDHKIAVKYRLGKEIYFTNGIGFDSKKFEFNNKLKEETRKTYNFNNNDILFLNVAEFSNRKNQKALINAFRKIDDENIKLVLAGAGKKQKSCEKLSKRLKLRDRVYFMNYVYDIQKLYEACDYYISASKSEGIPFSVLEAANMGLPLVLSNIKGHRDILKDANGLLFSREKEIPAKMHDILIYKKSKNDLSKFDLNAVKKQIMDIYCDE